MGSIRICSSAFHIRNDNNKGDISKDSYYYKWFDTDNIQVTDEGIYLNPASNEVLEYIMKGFNGRFEDELFSIHFAN